MTSPDLKHSTLVLERICAAPVERVFAAFSNPEERASWGTPSETAVFIYDKVDFREGGIDVFRCGDKSNPRYRGVTTYYDIVPNKYIISSEVVESQGRKLLISMSTTVFEPEGSGTKVLVTVQLTSLAGEDMLNGAKFGHDASLDNLVKAMQ
ncbi:MAG: SRPBCC domain-containing protein [Stellaceae bacterium]